VKGGARSRSRAKGPHCSMFSSVLGLGGRPWKALQYLPCGAVAITLGRLRACLLPSSPPLLIKTCLLFSFQWKLAAVEQS